MTDRYHNTHCEERRRRARGEPGARQSIALQPDCSSAQALVRPSSYKSSTSISSCEHETRCSILVCIREPETNPWFQIMVCKEEFVSWFKESVSYKRLDLMCTLLNMCLPFELRFLGTCLEELGKRDFSELRDTEGHANNATDCVDAHQTVSDKHTRRKLALYLALLNATNHSCSNIMYKTLANFDFAEIQTLISNPNSVVNDGENVLDELLLLYTIALNHPAFTFEQKSVFGTIFLKLQEEENKQTYSKPTMMYMKPGICFPCTATPHDAATGGMIHQYGTALKPLLFPSTGLANSNDVSKAVPLQEVAGPTFFHVATSYANTGGPQVPNSVLVCLPPPSLAQSAANSCSASEYVCPQAGYMVPSMGDLPCAAAMGPMSVASCVPGTANPDLSSPCGSPCGSPLPSRSESPSCGGPVIPTGSSVYGGVAGDPPRHGSCSSSSSSCSGGSTSGYRNSRASHPRNKPAYNSADLAMHHLPDQQRLVGGEQLGVMLASMNLTNGVCSGEQQRQDSRSRFREDKRTWLQNSAPPQMQNSGSGGSSQSESPSPPRSPPQDESWEGKDEGVRWDKLSTAPMPVHCARTSTAQALQGPRPVVGSVMLRRPQDTKHGTFHGRRPDAGLATAMPLAVYPTAPSVQSVHTHTGQFIQTNPAFLTSSGLFTTMVPHQASGPASFPPYTPNGITTSPSEVVYAVPPPSQTSPPPLSVSQQPQQQALPPQQQMQHTSPPPAGPPQFSSGRQPSSPPPNFMHTPSFPPPNLSGSTKLTCYNCGGSNHRGADCHEPSIEEIMRRGHYRIDFTSPTSVVEAPMPSLQPSASGGPSGGSSATCAGTSSSSSSSPTGAAVPK